MAYIERAVDFEPLPVEERAAKEGDGRTLEGYAAVFDADTEINSWEGSFKERISRGAFRKTLKERQPVLQFDHGHDSRFGSLPIGSFEQVKEDKQGLRVQARLFDHAEPIREAIASGAVSGMSFRMKVVRDTWHDAKGNEIKDRAELLDLLYSRDKKRGPLQRTIKEVKLLEAGPVVFPAYTQTSVGVRSNMTDEERRQRLEDLVREGEGAEVDESAGVSLREVMDDLGITEEEVAEFLRAENPFAKKGEAKPKPGDDTATDPKKPCTCDKVKGKHTVGDHKKTSSGGDSKKPAPKSEKKSEDDESVAPEVGADDEAPRSEDPNDAAQAGTSTGMSSNARERALSLLDI